MPRPTDSDDPAVGFCSSFVWLKLWRVKRNIFFFFILFVRDNKILRIYVIFIVLNGYVYISGNHKLPTPSRVLWTFGPSSVLRPVAELDLDTLLYVLISNALTDDALKVNAMSAIAHIRWNDGPGRQSCNAYIFTLKHSICLIRSFTEFYCLIHASLQLIMTEIIYLMLSRWCFWRNPRHR